ncbi:MAG: endonuclease V [Candidatus Bathyarchaeota archaeon]|nr:endonuclease V [Candidatus Bathyarchaeota archaeon]MDH5494848.1 endonuclease V [Candidatus Bathyarchaeota archaeon]
MSLRKSKRKKVSSWFSVKKAHAAQLKVSKRIIWRDTLSEKIRYVGGVDVAYTEEFSVSAAAVLDYDSLSLVESKTTHVKTEFPYIPTLLSFREIPPAVAVIKKLCLQPDVLLVDGQGIMHPYRLGFASHLGLVLGKPTIGAAKSPLIGDVGEFNAENWAPITDKKEVVGVALITRKGTHPVYVSVGHMVSLERAIEVVKHCTPRYRISKPIRLAHNLAAQEKRKVQNSELAKRDVG